MERLNLVVEGQTEETFVSKRLACHFARQGIVVSARCVETNRSVSRKHRGGVTAFAKFAKDLSLWMKQDKGAYYSMMVDLYKLPGDFPGFKESITKQDIVARVQILEDALMAHFESITHKFVPYIQIHEFEALLLSDVSKFSYYFSDEREISKLDKHVAKYSNPELVNDSEPPAKLIAKHFAGYQKVSDGALLAIEIGLDKMREECPHFNSWINKLEAIAS